MVTNESHQETPSVESLIESLQDKNSFVRVKAATILGTLKDRRAVEPLAALLKHFDKNTQIAAAKALGEIGDPEAINPLSVALTHEYHETQDAIREALTKLDPMVRGPLATENLCENCQSRAGSPAYFHYGTSESKRQRGFFKEKITTTSQVLGTSYAVICADCAAKFRWKSLKQILLQGLGATLLFGVMMLIPVVQVVGGCGLAIVIFSGAFLLLGTLFNRLSDLAEELAINIKKSEFERRGFNGLWTPTLFKASFHQTSPVAGLWRPPTAFSPGNTLKISGGVASLGILLVAVYFVVLGSLMNIGVLPADTPEKVALLDQKYGWYTTFSVLACITGPLAFVIGTGWFIGTYKSTKA